VNNFFLLPPKSLIFIACMKRTQLKQEYIFRASPQILYQFLTTPSCLIRWFCDNVEIDGEVYTFYWGDSTDEATVVEDLEDEVFSLRWEGLHEDNEKLEFRITEAPVTGETILTLTDYCDDNEVKDQKRYWDKQMGELQVASGGG
jgi:uncharacterized protein YndB with AHSA1/START domain